MAFDLKDYEPVEDRIKRFYKDNPEGRILTEIVSNDGKTVVMKAGLYRDSKENTMCWATGFAEEVRGEGFVNKTSHIENCETSAIGRALANANYAGSKRASREEMEKVERQSKPSVLNAEQVAKLISLAKLKGAATKEEAVEFINQTLACDDFTKLDPEPFDEYKAVMSDPKTQYTPEIPF